MNRRRMDSILPALACLALALGGAGCTTTAMKGTPFFSGEYSKRLGPPEERVNLWPLLYYRDPALSVLWPLIDYTDDYFAFRPLFSVYGLDGERQEYNVLWPLMHFEEGKGDNWILPVFWGNEFLWTREDYVVGFPLYWHVGHPLSDKGGFDSLFPLWCYRTERDGYDLNLAWPLIEFKSLGSEPRKREGWRLWPLYGSYREGDDRYRFAAWPLAQFWWNDRRDESTQCVFPLWYRERDRGHSLFLSLPYSGESRSDGRSWTLVPPFAYRSVEDGKSLSMFTPLYWQGRDSKEGSSWDLAFPLFYSSRDRDGGTFATLLGGWHRSGADSWWFALPALSGGRRDDASASTWWLGGLGYLGCSGTREEWHAFPLCYSMEDSNRWLFVSLPWSGGGNDKGAGWSFVPPVWYRSHDAEGDLTVTPLYMRGGETGGARRQWSVLLPFYYRRTSDRGTATVTLLGGVETDRETGRRWMLYPLLTGGRAREDEGSLWVLAPMFHAEWDRDSSSHHLLPLYYWNGKRETFLSLPYSRWRSVGAEYTVVPPLLSLYSESKDRSDLWTAAGLVHWSWGKDAGSRHVLPLYAGDTEGGWHATPLFASWRYGKDGTGFAIPPLLALRMAEKDRSDLWIAGPLAHFSGGEKRGSSHVFPLAYWNSRESKYITPLFATWRNGVEGRQALIPPLLGYYSRNRTDHDLWLALGLFHTGATEGKEVSRRGHLLPLYLFDDGLFLTPLFGWNTGSGLDFVYPLTPLLGFWRNERSGMWLFPLFSRCRDPKTDTVAGNVLWGLYRTEPHDSRFTLFPLFFHHRWDRNGTNEFSRTAQSEGYDTTYLLFGRCYSMHGMKRRYLPATGGRPASVMREYDESVYRFFPLWRFASESWDRGEESTRDFRLLLLLYDHRREFTANPKKDQPANYVRSRVLYRLWHYERLDDAVSVDVFPAITYDRRGDEMRKFTFLWRGFRYERSGDQKKVDLLFIPVWRSRWLGGEE